MLRFKNKNEWLMCKSYYADDRERLLKLKYELCVYVREAYLSLLAKSNTLSGPRMPQNKQILLTNAREWADVL